MTGYEKWYRPHYGDVFPIGDAYQQGIEWMNRIDDEIMGGIGCSPEDGGLLAEMVYRAGNSDHLELGTLFGATAILAAIIKREFDFDGQVFCVDNFGFLRDEYPVGPDLVLENAARFDVDERLTIIKGDTYPLPVDVGHHVGRDGNFGSTYIDAAHDFASCQRDWISVKDMSNAVAFHDYDMEHMGVVSALRNAMQEPGWWLVHLSHHTAILERIVM